MDDMDEQIRKLREDKERLIKANYELARRVDTYRELLQDSVDIGQGHFTALQDIINIVNSGPVDDDAAGKIRDICHRRLFSSFNKEEPNDDMHTMISDLFSYIWEEFKKAENDQAAGKDNDCFSNEDGDMGYYMGKYVAMKKIVESDEFKKLDALCEKEESNESV